MSLRWKLVLALVCLTAVASGAVGLLSYRSTASQLDSEVNRSLQSAIGDTVSAVAGINGPRRRPVASAQRQGIDLQYLGPNGSIRTAEGSADLPVNESDRALARSERRGDETLRDETVDGVDTRILTFAVGNGRGAVQAARSIEETGRVLDVLRTRILLVTLSVAGVAALLGVILGESITRRLLRLTHVAETVAVSGAPTARIPGEGGLAEGGVPQEGTDEVARLGVAFNEMLAALARSEVEQARLVQDAGHELRTPMTSLRTNIFSLRGFGGLDDASRTAVIEDLEGETEELSRLIEEVLEIASGEMAQEARSPVDLPALVRREAERTGRRWNRLVQVVDASEVTGGSAVDALAGGSGRGGSPLVLSAGAKQLARAVRNLIDNAAKFSPPDSPIEVVISCTDGPGERGMGAQIEVLDRGPGFEPNDLEAVFGRFHRSEAARSLPGSGLGLSMVAAVAASHGGATRASNRVGGGASVMLWIPLSEP